jgi:CheY-like chemotaxis protein/tetratricopeptide (TPR) repeat protein
MRLEVDFTPSVAPPLVSDDSLSHSESDAAKSNQALMEGVKAAQSGDRESARTALLCAAKLDAKNENAWLWLASISEYPEELMAFLENVLAINPKNERALQWMGGTKTLLSKTFVQRGTDAAEAERKMYAEDCFKKALDYDPDNTAAMLWLASLTGDPDDRVNFLKRVLAIDPENPAAKNALASILSDEERSAFALIKSAALGGDIDGALSDLSAFNAKFADNVDGWMLRSHLAVKPAEKLSALERVLEIDSDNEAARLSLETLKMMFGEAEPEQPLNEPKHEAPLPSEPAKVYDDLPEIYELEPNVLVDDSTPLVPEFEIAEPGLSDPFATIAHFSVVAASENGGPDETPIAVPAEEFVFEATKGEIPELIEVMDDAAAAFQIPEWQPMEPAHDWNRETVAYDVADLIPADEPAVYSDPELVEALNPEFAIPIPDGSFDENSRIEPQRTGFETQVEGRKAEAPCPYCTNTNEPNAFVCKSCFAALTLSDMELLLNNNDADRYAIRKAVDAMESERSSREFSEAELTNLGIAHLNLRNLQEGYDCLRAASRLNSDNILLESQLNALHIRIEEIRWQDEVHAGMSKGKTILVVDDSATVRKLISGKLQKCGHQVFCSSDGVEAMDRLKSLVPDLVLLDISMPRMDGYQVCRQIRGHSATANVPVVMISGKDGFFDKVRGRMAGTTGYITKPFGPETLMKAVEYYLNGGTGPEEFTEPTETVH